MLVLLSLWHPTTASADSGKTVSGIFEFRCSERTRTPRLCHSRAYSHCPALLAVSTVAISDADAFALSTTLPASRGHPALKRPAHSRPSFSMAFSHQSPLLPPPCSCLMLVLCLNEASNSIPILDSLSSVCTCHCLRRSS